MTHSSVSSVSAPVSIERDLDAMVKSSESDEWYRVGTLAPICLTMLRVSTVFMDPGGPAIMLILPLRKCIFLASKIGQGEGRGSPLLTPRLTVLWRDFKLGSLGRQGPKALPDERTLLDQLDAEVLGGGEARHLGRDILAAPDAEGQAFGLLEGAEPQLLDCVDEAPVGTLLQPKSLVAFDSLDGDSDLPHGLAVARLHLLLGDEVVVRHNLGGANDHTLDVLAYLHLLVAKGLALGCKEFVLVKDH